jgi:hypothetical protein
MFFKKEHHNEITKRLKTEPSYEAAKWAENKMKRVVDLMLIK